MWERRRPAALIWDSEAFLFLVLISGFGTTLFPRRNNRRGASGRNGGLCRGGRVAGLLGGGPPARPQQVGGVEAGGAPRGPARRAPVEPHHAAALADRGDRKSTRLNSSH